MAYDIPPETLHALASFDTCTVANAIETFDVQLRNEGFTDPTICCRIPELPPMLGFAATLRVRSSSPAMNGKSYLDRTDWWSYLESLPAPHVLVIQDMDKHLGCGAFIGEIHAAILKAMKCAGIVTNGAARDLPASGRLGINLFSGSVSASHAYAHVVEVGGAVEVGGLQINPGDLLHGDMHGIVRIPRRIVLEIPPVAKQLRKREKAIRDYCKSEAFSLDGLREVIKESGEHTDAK